MPADTYFTRYSLKHIKHGTCILLTRLFKHTTGQSEQPNVQQQHIQPHSNHFTFTGKAFFKVLLIRNTVSLNSSGAT